MNKKLKTVIFITLLVLVALSVIYITSFLKKGDQNPVQPTVIEPRIPKLVENNREIQSTVSKKDFSFPEKLPLVKLNSIKETTESEAIIKAQNLGFSQNYKSFNDLENGKMLFWNEDGKSLIIYLKNSKIVYAPGAGVNNFLQGLDQKTIIQIARNFLTDNSLVNETNLGTVLFYGLSTETEEPKIVPFNDAVVYKIVFSPVIENYEIITTDSFESVVSVWIDKQGRIIKTEINPIDISHTTDEMYPVKDYDSFIKTINSAQIINIDDGNILTQDIESKDILDIKVNNIKISYYKESDSIDYLQPVFVLSGNVTLSKKGKVNAILYLPAINNQP